MPFHVPENSAAGLLASVRSVGGSTLVLRTGHTFTNTPSVDAPAYVTVFTPDAIDQYGRVVAADERAIFEVTGRSDETLTASPISGEPDIEFPVNSKVYGFIVAEHLIELQSLVGPVGGLPSTTDKEGFILHVNGDGVAEWTDTIDGGTY